MPSKLTTKQGGFTLIEMMASFLILAIGLLGMMSLQNASITSGRDVFYRLQAAQLAQDMADRIRANRLASADAARDYDLPSPADHGCNAIDSNCTPQQMAQTDFSTWTERVAQLLPNGTGTVCIDSSMNDGPDVDDAACDGTGNAYAIKLWWYEGDTEENLAAAAAAGGGEITTADLVHMDITDGPSMVVGIVP